MRRRSLYNKFSSAGALEFLALGILTLVAAAFIGSKGVAFLGIMIVAIGLLSFLDFSKDRRRRDSYSRDSRYGYGRDRRYSYSQGDYSRDRRYGYGQDVYRRERRYGYGQDSYRRDSRRCGYGQDYRQDGYGQDSRRYGYERGRYNRMDRDPYQSTVYPGRQPNRYVNQPNEYAGQPTRNVRQTSGCAGQYTRNVRAEPGNHLAGMPHRRTKDEVPREFLYFYVVDRGELIPLVDTMRVQHLMDTEKFRRFHGYGTSLIQEEIEFSQFLTVVNGCIIPRNYVVKAFLSTDRKTLKLALFEGEWISLHFREKPDKERLGDLIGDLHKLYPHMEYLQQGGSSWYKNNANAMCDEAARDARRTDYDGMRRIVERVATDNPGYGQQYERNVETSEYF